MRATVHPVAMQHSYNRLDAFPCTRGHCLLLPKDSGGSPDVTHMPPAAAASFLSALPAVCSAVAQGIPGCDGVTVIQNNGASAGQLVQHPHFHIIPRQTDDKLHQTNFPPADCMLAADVGDDRGGAKTEG